MSRVYDSNIEDLYGNIFILKERLSMLCLNRQSLTFARMHLDEKCEALTYHFFYLVGFSLSDSSMEKPSMYFLLTITIIHFQN
jgi:hypothetical protein